jgi:hypothetical protein
MIQVLKGGIYILLTKVKYFAVKDRIFLVTLFSLFIFLACYNLLLIENNRPGKLLLEAAEHMETHYHKLDINIQEKGPGYSIFFSGKKTGEKVQGSFLDYKLQVYKNKAGKILVKDLKDGIWKEAEELGLGTLQNFFISPFELLMGYSTSFKKSKFINVSQKEEKGKVIALDIPALPLTIKDIYPHDFVPDSINIEFLVSIEEDDLFVKELSISLYDKDSLRKILSRTFTFQNGEAHLT